MVYWVFSARFQIVKDGQLQPTFLQRSFVGLCVHTWDLAGAECSSVSVSLQHCGCCPVVVDCYWVLCHTQCIRNLAWGEQWSGSASVVSLPHSMIRALLHLDGLESGTVVGRRVICDWPCKLVGDIFGVSDGSPSFLIQILFGRANIFTRYLPYSVPQVHDWGVRLQDMDVYILASPDLNI